MIKKGWLVFSVVFLCVGCAFIKGAIQDYQSGKTTPIAEGEKSPKDLASDIVDLVKAVPVVGNYSGVLLPILVGFFTWRRGRKIRFGRGDELPVTGLLGNKIGIGKFNIENIVRLITDTVHGAFEIGADGSAVKRTWKVWLSIILASISGALFIPGVREFLTANVKSVAIISFLAGLFGGIEKKLQSIETPK